MRGLVRDRPHSSPDAKYLHNVFPFRNNKSRCLFYVTLSNIALTSMTFWYNNWCNNGIDKVGLLSCSLALFRIAPYMSNLKQASPKKKKYLYLCISKIERSRPGGQRVQLAVSDALLKAVQFFSFHLMYFPEVIYNELGEKSSYKGIIL